jgi:hypothetical protein
MTLPQAAKQLNMSAQCLRVWIQQVANHPFGYIIRDGRRKSYYISEERMKAWMEGKNNES